MDGVLKTVCVCFKELNTGGAADDADEMPDVQETVIMIPGSTLLWRITPRPAHSDRVTLSCFFLLPLQRLLTLISGRYILYVLTYSWIPSFI